MSASIKAFHKVSEQRVFLRYVTNWLYAVFSIWCAQSHVHAPALASLVSCMSKIACTNSVYDTYCLGHWNEENERRNKTSNLIVDHFSLTIVTLPLVWMLYLHVWLQNNGKFLFSSEYYNHTIPFRMYLLEPRQSNLSNTDTCSAPYQTSKMECFTKIVND